MRDEITIIKGAVARCNRCDAKSPYPKEARANRENSWTYRIQDMVVLECGHMDAHWVFVADNPSIDFSSH